jgi:hypothetical protein
MGYDIRPAVAADAQHWLDLVRDSLGENYPAPEIYDLGWIARQLDPATGHETWVAEVDGRFEASISFLRAENADATSVANLGRTLNRTESFTNGSAQELLRSVNQLASQRKQMVVARIPASSNAQQILYENAGYSCVGFQPLKHMLPDRTGILFYVRGAESVLVARAAISESLPQISELAAATFETLQISNPLVVRDGATGYPLQSDLSIHESMPDDFELWRMQAQASNPAQEISGRFNHGYGQMRIESGKPLRALLGQRDQQMVAGLSFYFDEIDRCARVTDGFSTDDLSMGALLQHTVKIAQDQLGAVYTEIDILARATRLLKSAEQLGFVPVAYLPAFFCKDGTHADVVKMVKLNIPYTLDKADFTSDARSVMRIIDRNFEDQKLGLAIINLLRPLSMFASLGDGELRKIARLFTQKLYRPGDYIFSKGDSGDEAYIVLRGQINIQLERGVHPVASIAPGKIFGELAFLDGSPRNAFAAAVQPTILLVVHRAAFQDLVRREPNLGMVVMRNLACDLAAKLRAADSALAAHRR